MKKGKIRLGVNIDHVATLRQVRGGTTAYPDLLHFARESVRAGADQITIHLREDRRHIQVKDLEILSKERPALLNLEMAAGPEMLRYSRKFRPDWVCFVPEKRQELTTEGGLDVLKNKTRLVGYVEKLQRVGIEISMFIEPSKDQIMASYEIGADAVEFHTGHWVLLAGDKKKREWNRLLEASKLAHHLGLGVHAGHGLDPTHTKLITKIPELVEVNIGHFLVCDALEKGLYQSVKKLKSCLVRKG